MLESVGMLEHPGLGMELQVVLINWLCGDLVGHRGGVNLRLSVGAVSGSERSDPVLLKS